MLDRWSDRELIAVLERRGYTVRDNRAAVHNLSWNRTAPFPEGVDFRTEAVEKLRKQITPDMVRFVVSDAIEPSYPGDHGTPEIHRAVLRIL